jgi:hypothetical protein
VSLDDVRTRSGLRSTELTVGAAGCAYVIALALLTRYWDYDIWGGLVVGPLLVAVTLPLLRRVAGKDGLPGLYPLLVTALIVKLAMSLPRWAVAFALYDGSADASSYNDSARELAPLYRHLTFPFSDQAGGFSTKVLSTITGAVYALIGPTVLGGFLVFSWLGFLGLLLCYRGARIAVPQLSSHRYAGLLFFLPSMAFWPSSIGKEAVITLAIGLVLYGAARAFTRRRLGLPAVAAGLTLAILIRPHVAALLAVSFSIGYLVRPTAQRTALTPVVKAVGIVLVGVAGLFVVAKAANSLGVADPTTALQTLDRQGELTARGGSSFEATPLRRPQDVVPAFLAVLFRPFPWEATSAQVLIAALEGTGLLVACVVCWRRIAAGLGRLRDPYVLMAAVYLFGFVFLFSEFANFGILARQRVQAYPFVLLFLSFAPLARRHGRAVHPRTDRELVP